MSNAPSHAVPPDPARLPGGGTVIPDVDAFDPRYPDMSEWASAGVRGGVPVRPTVVALPATATQADIQRALDDVSATADGGAVELARGVYTLDRPLVMRAGVVLRGPFMDQVKLHVLIRHTWNGEWHPEPVFPAGVSFDGVSGAGLEQLTVCYDESLPRPRTTRHIEPAFDDNPAKDNPHYVTSIELRNAADCWVEGVRVVDSGSSPLSFVRSTRCSARLCELSGAHNKHGGMAYLNVSRSTHTLLYGLIVKDLRHLSIQNAEPEFPCRFNVVRHCDLEVDVNYHNGDSGHNLVEDCRVAIPSWHWWGPFAYGVKGQHQPPGPGNLIHRCRAIRFRQGLMPRASVATDAETVYEMKSSFEAPESVRAVGPSPAGRWLHAVRER